MAAQSNTVGHTDVQISPQLNTAASRRVEAALSRLARDRMAHIHTSINRSISKSINRKVLGGGVGGSPAVQRVRLKLDDSGYKQTLKVATKPIQQKVKLEVDRDGSLGSGFGGSLGRLFGRLFKPNQAIHRALVTGVPAVLSSPAMLAGVAAAGVILGGALAASVSSALLLGVGGGFLALGVMAVAQAKPAQRAWESATSAIQESLGRAARPLIPAILESLSIFQRVFTQDMAPVLRQIFKALAPVLPAAVKVLADAMVQFLTILGQPNVMNAVKVFMLQALPELARLAKPLADFFVILVANAPVFLEALRTLVTITSALLPALAEQLVIWSNVFNAAVKFFKFLSFIRESVISWFVSVGKAIASTLGKWFRWVAEVGIPAVGAAFGWLNQNIFQPIWGAIKAAFTSGGNTIGQVGNAIGNVLRTIGGVFSWLYQHTILPVWGAIKVVLGAFMVALRVLFGVWRFIWLSIAAIFTFVWREVILVAFRAIRDWVVGKLVVAFNFLKRIALTVWNAIRAAITTAWNWIKTRIFQPLVRFVNARIAPIFRFLLRVARVVWQGIQGAIHTAWAFIRDRVFAPLRRAVVAIGRFFRNLWTEHIVPAWRGIRNALKAGWDWIRENVFNPISNFITKTIPNAFETGKDAIARIWDKLRRAVAKPVIFVLETVYEQGLRAGWNKLTDIIPGLPDLPSVSGVIGKLKKFATGGMVRGPGGPTSDRIPAMLSDGEFVVRAKAAKAIGPERLHDLNRLAIGGFPSSPGAVRGDTGVWRGIAQLARKWGHNVNVSSGYRAGDPLWHGSGLAVDLGGFNQDKLAGRFLSISRDVLELIHRGRRDYGVSRGRRWAPGRNNALLNAHRDHIHVAMTRAAVEHYRGAPTPASSGGGLLDFGALFKGMFNTLANPLRGLLKGKPIAGPIGNWMLDSIRDSVANMVGLVGGSGDLMKAVLAQAQSMGASRKVLLALFSAGFVESGFRNLNFGDRDSVGFLQQRPSQGWGSISQIMNPAFATRSFVRRAMQLEGRYGSPGALAQAVQVSAFPGRYADFMSKARAALSGLGVFDQGGMLPPGVSAVVNSTRNPEVVLTGRQWSAISSLAHEGANKSGHCVHEHKLYVDGEPIRVIADEQIETFADEVHMSSRKGTR